MKNGTDKAKKLVGNTKKAINDKLKELGKIVGLRFTETENGEILSFKMKKAAKIKSELDRLQSQVQKKAAEYEEARADLLQSLPGSEKDTVDIELDGVRVHKYPRNTMAGKLDEDKVSALAKKKGIFRKVFTTQIVKKKVVNANVLIEAIAENKITYEEYMACTKQSITPVVEISYIAPVENEVAN